MANKPQLAAQVLVDIAARLPDNGLDDRRRDARHLLALALDRTTPVLPHEDVDITSEQLDRLDHLIERRIKGEPISRIRGYREFYSLDFHINPATLDPRADSETLVEAALWVLGDADWLAPRVTPSVAPRVLDLGTGSGCLLLAILANAPTASGIGVDIQEAAAEMARQNAECLGLASRADFQVRSWDDGLDGQFDLVISNPPYIPRPDLGGLMDEVRLYDPILALDGGDDGLDAWRALAPVIARRLYPHGTALVEIGQGQGDEVAGIFDHHGLRLTHQWPDLAGVTRCLQFSGK
ncbi:MAG: peptide chain release factor N(5)-glutamine methyltransferase [Alphaproteobacteria bacterium]